MPPIPTPAVTELQTASSENKMVYGSYSLTLTDNALIFVPTFVKISANARDDKFPK